MTRLRLIFMGTPAFAVPALRALHGAGHQIVVAYCQPPKPAGRGHQLRASAVQEAAESLGIPVRAPKTLRDPVEQAAFAALKPDIAVVAAYGLILPPPVLVAPRLGCINIHGSLLPRWRGAAPIQRAILAGDAETGITIMQMEAGLDTGPMLLKQSVPITETTTSAGLFDTLAVMGAMAVVKAVDELAAGRLTPQPQDEALATHAAKLTREDGLIDWNQPAAEIERRLRALNPWPGCAFMAGGETIKLLEAEIVSEALLPPRGGEGSGMRGELGRGNASDIEDSSNVTAALTPGSPQPSPPLGGGGLKPGTLLDNRFTVACGQGALRLTKVQRPGKPPVDGAAFLRGSSLGVGQSL